MLSKTILSTGLLGATALAQQGQVENRTLDDIYQAALAEGGVVTLWHGGDETNQQNDLKTAFEAKFPGMTLNVTVDLSKYHDSNIDDQLEAANVYVDSVILQTLHDYPRWSEQGALLAYKPLGWEQVYADFKDDAGTYCGLRVFFWQNVWSTTKLPDASILEFSDFLKPEFTDKLVLTYPNDDDAVLFAFKQIVDSLGKEWLDGLIAQNPRWVRGTATPGTILMTPNETQAATFTTSFGFSSGDGFNVSSPVTASTTVPFVSWPQTGAILKDAPHPEAAKLLHSWILSDEFQAAQGYSVREDTAAAAGFPAIWDNPATNVSAFADFMADRAAVERLRFFYENRIGSAQGFSPLFDEL